MDLFLHGKLSDYGVNMGYSGAFGPEVKEHGEILPDMVMVDVDGISQEGPQQGGQFIINGEALCF